MSDIPAATEPGKEVPAVRYSEDELKFRSKIVFQLDSARWQREQPYTEFDDQTYSQWRTSNAKARYRYNQPKENEEDIRITSGTTGGKVDALLAYLLSLNIEGQFQAYGTEGGIVHEMGDVMQRLVVKSRKIEIPDWDTKRIPTVDEFLTHGNVCVEDTQQEYAMPYAEVESFGPKWKDIKWEERMDKVVKFLSANMLDGLGVYFGNIKQPYLQLQPYIGTRRMTPRAEMEAVYGGWERWDNVPYDILKVVSNTGDDTLPYENWTLERLRMNMVEEIKYFNPWTNDYQILLNGVMMLPCKRKKNGMIGSFPLNGVTGGCGYPLAWGAYQMRPAFIYSPNIPQNCKVDQKMFDESLRLTLLAQRKSFKPPLSVKGKQLSRRVFWPGFISYDTDPDKIKEIGTNKGVTNAQLAAVRFLKEIIDAKTVSPTFEGNDSRGQRTARQVVEEMKQSMMKAGLCILGLTNLHRDLDWLRVNNIITHWTDEVDTRATKVGEEIKMLPIYRTITMDDSFDGTKGKRIVKFTNSQMPTPQQIMAEESIHSNTYGGIPVRVNYMNVDMLKAAKLTWFINEVPSEGDSDMLRAVKFEDTVMKIIKVLQPLGARPNLEYIGTRMAELNGENPDKLFLKGPAPMPPGAPAAPAAPGGEMPMNPAIAPMAPTIKQMITQS